MINDHIEARLWAEHGPEFNQSIANGLSRLARVIKRLAARRKSRLGREASDAAE